MSTAVNSGSAPMATASSTTPTGPSPTPGQRNASQSMRQDSSPAPSKRNTNSPSNDNTSQQRRSSKGWNAHVSQQGQAFSALRANTHNGRQSPITESDNSDRHLYDRLLYLLIRSLGSNVIATVRSGARYSGVLSSAQTHDDLGVVLRFARQIAAPPGEELEEAAKTLVVSTLVIQPKDLLDIKILEVNLTDRNGFRTDADISKTFTPQSKERELQPWKPDDAGPSDESLDDMATSSSSRNWDQFAVNEKLFGVQSTFDENLYTTKLDKSHPQYKERLAAAEKIAREIEGSSHNGNVHMAEERGIVIDDSGADEEDKYSGVVRDNATLSGLQSGNANRYTPPALRQKSATQRPQQSPAAQPQVAPQQPPVDSAILSSKVVDKPATGEIKALPDSKTATVSAPTGSATTEGARLMLADIKASVKEKQDPSSSDFDHQMIGTFKQFVHGEKERLNSKKREASKKEKEGRLSELMEFSQKFKLHTPVPMDLVPILAKDKAKQDEIIQKSAVNAQHGDSKRPLTSSAIASSVQHSPSSKPASPAPISLTAKLMSDKKSTSPLTVPSPPLLKAKAGSPAPAATKKFNVNAHEFKPNPFAASFTPSFTPAAAVSPAAASTAPSSAAPTATPGPASATPTTTPGGASPTATGSGTPQTASKSGSRSESPLFFGSDWQPATEPRAQIGDAFNPFVAAKEAHTGENPFNIVKTYVFAPIWPYADGPSYLDFFTVPEPVSSQRIFGIPPIPGAGPVPFSPRVPQPVMSPVSPSMSGSASPYPGPMPPSFDDSMRHIIPGASPPVASPNMAPPQMMQPPASFSPNVMYTQHPYPPPGYFAGRPPNMLPGFMGGPPQQFMAHQPFPNYIPPQQMSSQQGYGSPGRNGQAAMMMQSNSQQGFNGGFYGQPQSKY
ncbi:hypothetical protein V1512DRAFT_208906 [Lipomyces arxii]|uniref:uncharacterized protein n=1 Tax=Lipomyces arxii TaxID=56418 RepID=UPI0034CF3CBF